jgi:alpha-beta hydrolase superfamily lysophospholipase
VATDLDRLVPDLDEPLFLTGHSLGGALATLAASRWPARACYTFGAPRVGDGAFARTLRAPLYRVVNGQDVVPRVPPASDLLGFADAGELHQLGAAAASDEVTPRDLAERLDERRWFDPAPFLADHAPASYVARLRASLS